jgi:hypothetical protein
MVLIPVYPLFSSYWLRLNICPVVALDPSMLLTRLDNCLVTLSNYGPGREPCTDKFFSPASRGPSQVRFQRCLQGDNTLIEHRDPNVVSLRLARITTIGLQLVHAIKR